MCSRRRPRSAPRGVVTLTLTLPLACAACALPPTTPAAPPTVEVPRAAPVPEPAPPEPPPPPQPIASAHVDATGCALEGPTSDRVALSHEGPSPAAIFAAAQSPEPVRVVLAEGGAPSSVRLRVFGLEFDAQLPENGVRLHARAPLALAGVYDPDAHVPLHWSTSPRLRVEVHGARVRALVPLAKDVACAAVGLGVVDFAARALAKPRYTARATRPLALLPAPGQMPAAELPKDTLVRVHAVTAALAEVSYEDAGLWHGFAPAADLARAREEGVGYGTGHGRFADRALPGFTCPAALPLYVRRVPGGEPLARVGTVRAGEHVGLEPLRDAPFRPLTAEQRRRTTEAGELIVRAGFELFVDAEASRACAPHLDDAKPAAPPP